jgi:uncharacterized protein (TIGR03000 family)
MKRLLLITAAIVLALVMTGAARADGKGKGNGHGGEGWHGWNYSWGNPGYYYQWENRWYDGNGAYRYYNYNSAFANPWYNSYPGFANAGNGYGNWSNLLSLVPSAFLPQGNFAPAFQSGGFSAPAYGAVGTYGPAVPAVRAYAQTAVPAVPGYAQNMAPPLPAAPNPAPRVQVVLPNPEAQVTIGGVKMESLGMVRTFELPPVDQGKSDTYKVTATWIDNGKPITDMRKVAVIAGSVAKVDFTQPAPTERVSAPVKSEPDAQDVNTPSKNTTPP